VKTATAWSFRSKITAAPTGFVGYVKYHVTRVQVWQTV
jgi:hypothetical protein